MDSEAGRVVSFTLTTSDRKEEIAAFLRSRGIASVSEMARRAFYEYLRKCHYPFKEASNFNPRV